MENIIYLAYPAIYLPTILYIIPYINTALISQKKFIRLCNYRILCMFLINYLYLTLSHEMYFTESIKYFFIGLLLLIAGQILNIAVYLKLGIKGVYYGIQYKTVLYKKIEKTFPFCIYHPLYLGGGLSYIGLLFIFGFKDNYFDPILVGELLHILGVQLYLVISETILDKIHL